MDLITAAQWLDEQGATMQDDPEQALIERVREMRASGMLYHDIAKQVGRTRYWVTKHAPMKAERAKPAWIEEARKLREEGMSWSRLGARFGVRGDNVRWHLTGYKTHIRKLRPSYEAQPRGAHETSYVKAWRPKAAPVRVIAGQPQPHIMDAAQAYVRGEITRDEMVLRLKCRVGA